jgi:transcriptional regulator with XRE-family HTH domain
MSRAAPATPIQIAMFGHVAASLRAALAAKGWSPGDLNRALGKERTNVSIYNYLNAKGAPGPDARAKLARVLGIKEATLVRRPVDRAVPVKATPIRLIEGPRAAAVVGAQRVLEFTVSNDGMAHLRLDVTLPSPRVLPLLRILLDAGLVIATDGR